MWEFGKSAALFYENTPNGFQVVLGKNTHAGGEYKFQAAEKGAFSANGKVYTSVFFCQANPCELMLVVIEMNNGGTFYL